MVMEDLDNRLVEFKRVHADGGDWLNSNTFMLVSTIG